MHEPDGEYVPMDEGRVHPDLRAELAARPPFRLEEAIALLRSEGVSAAATADPRLIVEDRLAPGPAGAPPVAVRLYVPAGPSRRRPAVLWVHGGGYVLGSALTEDPFATALCLAADVVVASVDYRLAPENPFPAGLEDVYAALAWLADEAPVGLDRDHLGGGLAAAVALLARDRGGPSLVFQMPLCPMLDDANATPSSREFRDPRVWNRAANRAAWAMYLGPLQGGGAAVPAYAAPARADDLARLPPAYIAVGALDPFRDEDIAYARRLAEAGVPTELHVFPGCFHGFEAVPMADVATRARSEYVGALRRGLRGQG